jgi:DNA-binding CsgD family transcriptional regulator
MVGTAVERLSDRPSRPLPPGAPLLVGRTRERVFLREELTAAIGGHGRLILLGGEAGIGKTTLAKDVAREATARGAAVLAGYCYDLTNTPPYGPWLDLVATYHPTDTQPQPPAAFAGGTLGGVTSQAALFAEVRRFVAELGAAGPVVLVLEDLHWADPASLELLRHIAPQTGSLPLLLVATYRVDELTRHNPFYQQIPALVREADGLRIDLRRLDRDELRALVTDRFALAAADIERLIGYLERHAEGNPFFVTELLRALQEESLLHPAGEGWSLAELDRVVMPSLLRQVIDARVARLGEETRQPLAIAAVIGQDVPLHLWATVAGLSEEDMLTIVEQAIEAHLLEAAHDGTRVHFVHALTREALYEGVLPPRRRIWHRQVAESLADGANPDPDTVAYHFQQAGAPRAVDWLIRAGERAQRAYAWLTAVDRLRAAADLLAGVVGQERLRGWLLYRIARLRRFSNPAAGVAHLEEAERLAQWTGDEFLRAEARYSRGLLLCYADDFALGVQLIEEGLATHEARTDADEVPFGPAGLWLADALPAVPFDRPAGADGGEAALRALGKHHRRATSAWFPAAGGHLAAAVQAGEEFIAAARTIADPGVLVRSATGHAYHGLGTAFAGLGQPERAREAFTQARQIYELIDHHGVIAFSFLTELRDVVIPYLADQPAERRRLANEAEAAMHRAGGAFLSGITPALGRLSCLAIDGRWDEALRIIEEMPPPGNGLLRREITDTLAYVANGRGESEIARAQIAAILPDGPGTPPGCRIHQEAQFLQRLAADLALDVGDLDGSRAWLEAHDRWFAWSDSVLGQADGRLRWARWHHAAGDLALARSCAVSAHSLAANPRQPLALLAADRLLGALLLDDDRAAAEHHLEASLALANACAVPFERALSLLELAALRLRTNRSAEADSLLAEASAIGTALGARPVLERARALGGRPAATAPAAAPAGLTPRELEVLHLVAKGLTDAEVADRLFISPRTVSQHLRSIYNKLDVPSRTAATRFAVEHGLA